jgi:GTP-binding protein
VQSRVIRERLLKEGERNVAIRVSEDANNKDAYEVAGRGELQLGILIETCVVRVSSSPCRARAW